MVPRLLTLLLLATASQAQMYDMKDGNNEGLISPCAGGPVGRWDTEEPASMYPGGPTDGLVLTSSSVDTSCLDTPTTVHLTRRSNLYIAVRVDHRATNEIFKAWIVNSEDLWIEWFSVDGPIAPNEEWIQDSLLIPNTVPDGDYIIRLDDRSSPYNVSLRYFEITETIHSTTDFPGYTGTPDTTVIISTETTSQTTTTIDPDTTTVVTDTTVTDTTPNSTRTTERVSTLHPTTERVSTLSPTTERVTTPMNTTPRPSKSPSLQ